MRRASADAWGTALVWIAVCAAAVLTTTNAAAESGAGSLVTEEERAWLDAHEPVRIAFDGYFPPYSFLGDDGALEGLAVDVVDLLAERLDITFEVAPSSTWAEVYDAATRHEVDVVATMVERPDRHEWFAFTRPYIFKTLVIVARDGDDRIRRREHLAGRTLALVESYQYVERILDEFPTATPRYYPTMVDALNAVSTGHADATVTYHGGGHYLRTRYLMTNLEFVAVYDSETSNERVAVRNDWPVLADVLDRGLASITESERLALEDRWLPGSVATPEADRLTLTESERAWIAEHPVIRVGVDPEFHPFEFIDEDGVHRGMSADYLAILGPRLGLTFEVVPDLGWSEVVERAERGEIDLLSAVSRTADRDRYLLFSEPYVEYQRVIVTRTDMPFLRGLDDLEGLRVAVQSASSHEGFLRENSTIDPIECPTLAACTRAVSNGEVDALVGNVASLAHWIRRQNLTNLKVAGATSEHVHTLHVATRADWPELAGILQKGFASITPAERQAIADRWVVLEYEPEVDRSSMWRVVAIASVALALLAAWIAFVRRQRDRLRRARDEAVAAEADAHAANAELERMRSDLEELVEVRTEELIAAERRFQEAQKMEALGTLVGGVAHDFNNLLQGILGAIYLVEEELDDPDHKRFLREAAGLGERGADLIRQLLAVARKGGGSKTEVDLVEMLAELGPILRTTLPSTIEFERDLAGGPLVVWGNAALLQQVVLNLVNNARDAVLGGDHPTVRLVLGRAGPDDHLPETAGPEGIRLDNGDGYAVIEIRDNGPGVPDDVAERIFEPFFTTKEKGAGTGLGLAMAFGAVRDHGGAIALESTPGNGATFRVFLPLHDAPMPAAESSGGAPSPGFGETILLADDEPVVRNNHAAILTRLGYRVVTAADGEQALERLAEHGAAIQLVILDVLMPNLDGPAVAERVRALLPDVPVLFLSAYDADGDLPDRLRPVGYQALAKPCTPKELSRAIRDALDARSTGAEPGSIDDA